MVPLGQDGAPYGETRAATPVPREATSLIVRSSGAKHGWFLAWTALLDRGESVSTLFVASDGSSQKAAFDVERTSDHVTWVDVVPTGTGGLCVWAEETASGDANILAVPLDGDGRPRGLPARIARGVLGWSLVPDGDGAALALRKAGGDGAAAPGTLLWLRIDADARPRGPAISVSTDVAISGDVDVVPAAEGWLLAWTDRSGEDPDVTLASIDAKGTVAGPRHAMETVGGASLVGLASGPAGIALAWTEPRARSRPSRSLHLASVSLEGPVAQPMTSIETATNVASELVATDTGFALLSAAPVCSTDAPAPCEGDLVPSFVRFDGKLIVVQTEPVYVGESHHAAALAWNLSCLGDRCVALAADAATPAAVFTVDLSPRTSRFQAPYSPALPAGAPRISGVVTVASGQPFFDLTSTRVGDVTLLATLAASDVNEHARSRTATQTATIAIRALDADGHALGPPKTITTRALPVGGVAIASGGRPEDGEAVAWVARDDGDPQVHLTHLDRRGQRTNEIQLTMRKGDASDVALAWASDGWMVAWVDGRDGNGEVYASKVDRNLHRVTREERITQAPGDAGDIAMVVHGDTALLAFSDPRESPREGIADIYAVAVGTADAKRRGSESRVLSTAAHSRSPTLSPVPGGALLAWIEDAPQGLDQRGAAVLARLDAEAHVIGEPTALPTADPGNPTAVTLASATAGARAFVVRSHDNDVSLDTVSLNEDGSPALPAWRLLDLDAPATFEVALAVSDNFLFFDDVGAHPTEHRVRRATVSFKR